MEAFIFFGGLVLAAIVGIGLLTWGIFTLYKLFFKSSS